MLRGVCAKHPVIAETKVNQGTEQNRDAVRDKDWHARLLNQESQDRKVSHHRDQPIREMKPHQSNQRRGIVCSVTLGVVQMPYKVMEYCKLNSRSGCYQVVAGRAPFEYSERGQLQHHAHDAHRVEFAPADQGVQGSGSCRYSSAVWRSVTKIAIANMLIAAIVLVFPGGASENVLSRGADAVRTFSVDVYRLLCRRASKPGRDRGSAFRTTEGNPHLHNFDRHCRSFDTGPRIPAARSLVSSAQSTRKDHENLAVSAAVRWTVVAFSVPAVASH